jgi:hypothetical protein
MIALRTPKKTRIKVRRMLEAYNDVRQQIPESQGFMPFIAQQLYDRKAIEVSDLLRAGIEGSTEYKFTQPAWFPHILEPKRNIIDLRSRRGQAILRDIEEDIIPGDRLTQIKREMFKQGFTGYYDEAGEFVPITLGEGVRGRIRSMVTDKDTPILLREPKFLERRTEAHGYVRHDPELVLKAANRQIGQAIKNKRILDQVRKHPSVQPWDGTTEGIRKGYVPFSFEGLNHYYTKQIDLGGVVTDAVSKAGYMADEVMREAILKHIPNELTNVPGMARKLDLVQIPKSMYKTLQQVVGGHTPGGFWRMYDDATQWWRFFVLAMSPRWRLNNIVGNYTLSYMGGSVPELDLIRRKMRGIEDYLPAEALIGGQTVAELGATTARQQRSLIYRMGNYVYSHIDAPIENYFRRQLYYNRATKLARKELMKKTGRGFAKLWDSTEELQKALHKIRDTPALRNRVMDEVNEFLFDYRRMDPLERAYIRRIIPFWGWYRNMSRLLITMPFKHPKRAWIINQLGEIGQHHVESIFAEMGVDYDDLPALMHNRIPLHRTAKDMAKGAMGMEADEILLSTRGVNIFSDVLNLPAAFAGIFTGQTTPEGRLSGFHPSLTVAVEQITGKQLYNTKDFTDPDVVPGYRGGSSTIDDRGNVIQGVRVAPPLHEHILRQTPQWQLIKELVGYIRTGQNGARNGTNTLLDPKFLIDRKTGQLKYPKSLVIETLKLLGLNTVWVQNWRELRAKMIKNRQATYGTMFNRELADPAFTAFAFDRMKSGQLSQEDELREARDKWRKLLGKERK